MRVSSGVASCLGLVLLTAYSPSPAQTVHDEPTEREIAKAFGSRSGWGESVIPGLRWETWRITKVRGWSLKFKRLSQKKEAGVTTRRYRAVAKRNKVCAEYQITEKSGPLYIGVPVKGLPDVASEGLKPCR